MSSKLTTILLDHSATARYAGEIKAWRKLTPANWQDSTTDRKRWTPRGGVLVLGLSCYLLDDYYLSNTTRSSSNQSRHIPRMSSMNAGLIPLRVYSNDELLEYLNYCPRSSGVINSLNDQTVFDQSRASHREDYSVLEILLYNLRHVQHHSAQLNLLLRQRIDSAPAGKPNKTSAGEIASVPHSRRPERSRRLCCGTSPQITSLVPRPPATKSQTSRRHPASLPPAPFRRSRSQSGALSRDQALSPPLSS